MKAHVEFIVGIIRTGEAFEKFGDPYEFMANIIIQNNEAFILGAAGRFDKKMYAAIKTELQSYGIHKVHWNRKKEEKTDKKVNINI